MADEGVHRQLAEALRACATIAERLSHPSYVDVLPHTLRVQAGFAVAKADAALRAYDALICTCGSGGHPRDCAMHPDRRQMHCQEIDLLNAYDRIKGLREAIKAHGQHCPQDNDLTSALAEDDGGLDV